MYAGKTNKRLTEPSEQSRVTLRPCSVPIRCLRLNPALPAKGHDPWYLIKRCKTYLVITYFPQLNIVPIYIITFVSHYYEWPIVSITITVY